MDSVLALTPRNCENDAAFAYFASNFAIRLKDFTDFLRCNNLPEPTHERRSTLAASVHGSFTEEHGHLLSYQWYDQHDRGEFDFSDRFEAEEVEWILNKPYFEGRTALHVEVLNHRVDVLEALLNKHEGIIVVNL